MQIFTWQTQHTSDMAKEDALPPLFRQENSSHSLKSINIRSIVSKSTKTHLTAVLQWLDTLSSQTPCSSCENTKHYSSTDNIYLLTRAENHTHSNLSLSFSLT